jgi:hypothetical protein
VSDIDPDLMACAVQHQRALMKLQLEEQQAKTDKAKLELEIQRVLHSMVLEHKKTLKLPTFS